MSGRRVTTALLCLTLGLGCGDDAAAPDADVVASVDAATDIGGVSDGGVSVDVTAVTDVGGVDTGSVGPGETDVPTGPVTDAGESPIPDVVVEPEDAADPWQEDTASACLDDLTFFEQRIWGPILALKCAGCHNAEGFASDTVMVLTPPDEPGALEANFAATSAAAMVLLQDTSVLLLKPAGLHPDGHTGGDMVSVGSQEYEDLVQFVARVNGTATPCDEADPTPACEEVTPGRRTLRRLTRFEFDRTITDLFGFPSTWGQGFTAESVSHGFDNQTEVVAVSTLFAEQLQHAAEAIAAQAVAPPNSVVSCSPALGEGCAEQVLAELGPRVFRRPLTDDELTGYLAVYAVGAAHPEPGQEAFDSGIQLLISALIQSPHFLYRSELGVPDGEGHHALTTWEIATQLSYFLWGTMPDQELFDRASDGSLAEPETIASQAERLLDSPRSHPSLTRFVSQWLDVELLPIVLKDSETYPDFETIDRHAMLSQTARLVTHVLFDGTGTLPELFLSDHAVLTAELAALYGLDAPVETDAEGFGLVDVSGTPYGGLLTEGSVLARHAFPTESSPIHRGKFVREQLLCQELAPPPPGLVAEIPPFDPTLTTRERFSAHSAEQPCSDCHRLIDPIGFGFEAFDGAGQYRENDGDLPIDATGEIVGTASTNAAFDGLGELSVLLAESPEVHACFARQWVRFAYGVDTGANLACLHEHLVEEFVAEDLDMRSLLVGLTQTPHFVRRVSDAPPDEEPEVDAGGDATADAGGEADTSEEDTGPVGPSLPDTSDLMTVEWTEDAWDSGFCRHIDVTNTSEAPLTWAFFMDVPGTINQVWNAQQAIDGGLVHFVGAEWNHTIQPGTTTNFGFCADK